MRVGDGIGSFSDEWVRVIWEGERGEERRGEEGGGGGRKYYGTMICLVFFKKAMCVR